MNILQLVPRLDIGGVEKGTVDLARYLTLNAHKAVIISSGGKLVKDLDSVGARHYILPIGRKNPFIMLHMVFKVREIISRENIDIVHARSRVPAVIGFVASHMTLKPFITTAHGQYKKHLMSYVMGWGKYVIVASSVMARYMIESFGVRPEKIRIVPRGVDTKRFSYRSPSGRGTKSFTVGMISRITPLKGHLDFIKAISIVSRSINRLKVYIVGSSKSDKSDYMKQIKLHIKRFALGNVVKLMEQTENVPNLLSELDVLVSANREQEAFGRIIIEAQSVGVPCVATKVGGLIDIIEDGVTGLLCEPANSQDMAGKILHLYREKSLRDILAENARASVQEKFNLEKMMRSTIGIYEKAIEEKRILIIKISALGDVILCIPSMRAIREKFPKASIKVLVGLESKDVLRGVPYIDEIIVCDFKNRDKGIKGFLRLARKIRKEDFDIVVDFQNNKKSHLLGLLSLAGLRYGYDNGKISFLLNRKVKDVDTYVDPIEHQGNVLRLMGIYQSAKEITLFPAEDDTVWAEKFLRENWVKNSGPIICLHLESSPKWVSKRWPVSSFVEIAERMATELFVRVIVTGQNRLDKWNKEFFERSRCKPISAVGKTNIGQLTALMKKCSVLVTSDSAPMHIAAGVSTPFVALFGPTAPKRHVPPANKCKIIFKDKQCAPCYKPTCKQGLVCMNSISPDEVFEAIKEILK